MTMTDQLQDSVDHFAAPATHSNRAFAAAVCVAAVGAGLLGFGIQHARLANDTGALNTASNSVVDGNGSTGVQPDAGGGRFSGQQPGTSTALTTATAVQQIGVVDIDTVLDYGAGKAAGTGVILNSTGEVLTNNHVVAESTSIRITVVATGKTYTARVVGTDVSDDLALLQIQGASGLATANLGDSSGVSLGDAVTGVGNAGGSGGTPSAASGQVVGLDRTITAQDESGTSSERLSGLIQTDAPIQAGDSGGPLYNASNQVIGIDTAASTRGVSEGYAIPIGTALSVAKQIESGVSSSTITQGYPGFLGVELAPNTAVPTIAGVIDGSAAESAGLAVGDVVTSVNGQRVSTPDELSSVVGALRAGERATVTWTDTAGRSHSATLTLGEGPVK